jgi:hypothetical protein
MGKIHTHYDNLKVSRGAPQEVIRAAYKALSQKYHPDKNPGDEKAARIMAIVNTAYGALADPVRRKEHDEWIAQEEWEVEWLESTRHEGQHPPPAEQGWTDHPVDIPRRRKLKHRLKLWSSLGGCVALGWVGGMLTVGEPHRVSSVLASGWGGKPAAELTATATTTPTRSFPRVEKAQTGDDGWAVAKPYSPEPNVAKPPPIKVVTLSQVVLPSSVVDCEHESPTLVAPNGEPWPVQSGYVDGFPVGNKGEDMQLTLDNASNAAAVFIKVYDLDRHVNVRYAFVQAHDKLVVDQLSNGKYEIRYQNIDLGPGKNGCADRRAKQAAS